MIKKIIFICLIFLFVSNCGYEPLMSKNTQFSLKVIELGGSSKINYIIKNRLKIYEEKNNNNYNLEIVDSKINKIITSKDIKGNPKTHKLTIKLNINIKENSNLIDQDKNFITSANYGTMSSKFELKKYEENLIKNLTEKILDDVILYIQTL